MSVTFVGRDLYVDFAERDAARFRKSLNRDHYFPENHPIILRHHICTFTSLEAFSEWYTKGESIIYNQKVDIEEKLGIVLYCDSIEITQENYEGALGWSLDIKATFRKIQKPKKDGL